MSIAIISDIHGNLDALEAVLADVDRRQIDRIFCLGDIVGYGPDPTACIDYVMQRCEWAMMGNHDFAVLYEPTSFNVSAEQACFWTRRQFEIEADPHLRRQRIVVLCRHCQHRLGESHGDYACLSYLCGDRRRVVFA